LWNDERFTPMAPGKARSLIEATHSDSYEGMATCSCYANYADEESIKDRYDAAKRMFGPNYPRMRQVKKKYDPNIRFNKWFTVEPAE
jgi:hypothetical protein